MKVKVKAKKGTYQSLFQTYMVVLLFVIIDSVFFYSISKYDNVNDIIREFGVAFVLVLVFAFVVIVAIIFTIKPPKKYSVILKRYYTKGNKHIYEFIQEETKAWNSGWKYVIESDEPLAIMIDNKYALYLKELNWEPKYLELDPITETYSSKITKEHQMKFVIWVIASAPIFLFSVSVYGLIFCPNYWITYVIMIIVTSYFILLIIRLLRNVNK